MAVHDRGAIPPGYATGLERSRNECEWSGKIGRSLQVDVRSESLCIPEDR